MKIKRLSILFAMVMSPFVAVFGQALCTAEECSYFPGKGTIFLQRDSASYMIHMLLYAPSLETKTKILSEGNFKQQGENISFKDRRSGFEMTALFINDNKLLIFPTGLPFLINDTIQGYRGDPQTIASMLRHYNHKVWATWQYPHEKIETLKSTPAQRKLSSGIYQNDYAFVRFKNNGEYELYYAANLVSNGTWKQENSCIILEDKGLKCNFYMGLDSNAELHSLLLPGFYAPEEQWLPFKKIDKFPEGTGDVPYEYETIEVIVPDSEFGSCISD